jgi:citrate synthase
LIHLINMKEWIDRAEALGLLGVKPQTLYAYVSRGLIEVRRVPDARRSLYRSEDVATLAGRRGRSRRPSAIAASSMAWGEPSIVTAISTVHRGRLIYRGLDAADFSRSATLEATARLLWGNKGDVVFAVPPAAANNAFSALAALVPESEASIGRGSERLCRDAQAAISHLAAACGLRPGPGPLHLGLAELWSLGQEEADLVRQALVLVADHELNASAFATRVAASTGAPIAACLLAGLSTLSGPKHGGAASAVLRLLDEAAAVGPKTAVRAWLDRDGFLPGFGHPLYPNGDIRAATLATRLTADSLMRELQECVLEATGTLPNIDFALTALVRMTRLPRSAPFTIFLLGRSIGWAAHAMEQARCRELIRPRARYDGSILPSQVKS